MPVEPGTGLNEWVMESPILGRVLHCLRSQKSRELVMVDGVPYRPMRCKSLMEKGLTANHLTESPRGQEDF